MKIDAALLKAVWARVVIVWKWLRRVFKTVLRFLNLLEPDVPYMVLSLSKLSVWLTLVLTIYVVTTGQGMMEIGAALVANVGSIGNYMYRRSQQVRTRSGGYAYTAGPDPLPTADFDEDQLP
jgi:hypothetical protein